MPCAVFGSHLCDTRCVASECLSACIPSASSALIEAAGSAGVQEGAPQPQEFHRRFLREVHHVNVLAEAEEFFKRRQRLAQGHRDDDDVEADFNLAAYIEGDGATFNDDDVDFTAA